MASADNAPGARSYANSWSDSAGNLWLFGGYGMDSAGSSGDLNDLWKYSAGQWTWMSGSNLIEQSGTYGTVGSAAASNAPGARYRAVSWTDKDGNFWLFGGIGIDSNGTRGDLNDLWKYSAGQWTWVSGSTVAGQLGVYGTAGVAGAGNSPGARVDAVAWADAGGNFWIFGGQGFDSAGTVGILNDLWKFRGGQWTWVSGSRVVNALGVYGTLGVGSANNTPGARANAVTWTDASGALWLFGGQGNDSTGVLCTKYEGSLPCDLNDLWNYSANVWTWVGGSNLIGQVGSYGTQGTAAATNMPGARWGAASWTDASGKLWLFGGNGFDSSIEPQVYGNLNDLWTYDGAQWTWVSGSNHSGDAGTYGTMGTAAMGNLPGARDGAVTWVGSSGNLWLFGGSDVLSVPSGGPFNDLWKFQP